QTLRVARAASERGVAVVALTDDTMSPLAISAQHVLLFRTEAAMSVVAGKGRAPSSTPLQGLSPRRNTWGREARRGAASRYSIGWTKWNCGCGTNLPVGGPQRIAPERPTQFCRAPHTYEWAGRGMYRLQAGNNSGETQGELTCVSFGTPL